MKCEKCDFDNPAKHVCCSNCGEPLQKKNVCSSCSKELPKNSKFCVYCGAKAKIVKGVPAGKSHYQRKTGKTRQYARTPAKRKGAAQTKWRVITFVLAGVIVVGLVGFRISSVSRDSRNINSGFGADVAWAKEVQQIASEFNCPCGKCGIIRLDLCTCDIPRGAVEVKSYIQNLLNESLQPEAVIFKVEERYGNRI